MKTSFRHLVKRLQPGMHAAVIGAAFTGFVVPANATDITHIPMAVNNLAKPNIMLVLDNSISMGATVPSTSQTRLQVAQTAASTLVNNLDRVRMGLFRYNWQTGGTLVEIMEDLDATKKTNMIFDINATTANSYTPIAETYADVGRYFALGNSTGNLTLHPGTADEATATVASVFNNHTYADGTGGATIDPPIQYWCQKSFTILLTDGLPTKDQAISADIREYYGYCSNAANTSNCVNSGAANGYGKRIKQLTGITSGSPGTVDELYESIGGESDYLDDVANALHDIDLRPDLAPASGTKTNKNNLTAYTIAFADPKLNDTTLLERAASYGGGSYYTASDAATLASAFQQVADDILSKDGSAAAVAVANANVTSGDNASYVSSYNSGTWTGDLIAYPINTTTGIPDINNPIWNTGCAAPSAYVDASDTSKGVKGCSAQVKLDSITVSSRKIATLKDESSTRTPVLFRPTTASTTTKLSTTQETALESAASPGPGDGANVVDYLRGDKSLETTSYRSRTHRLGDLVNSEPVVQREPSFSYADDCYSATISGKCTSSFKAAKATRTRMVYIGGNDGMLHAFNAADGVEEWAYVPRFTWANLNNLTKKSGFVHKYTVDGTPVVGDVDFSNTDGVTGNPNPDWRTILVGGLGKGGRGFYALDITCPVGATVTTANTCGTTLTEDNVTAKVLWEFPSSDSTHATHFANVGYSFGKPVITKTAKGWVVLVTSGYNNGTGTDNSGGDGHGYLYVLNAKTGALIKAIDTTVGTTADPSGLAQIAAYADSADIDNTTTYVYGGDLKGNVWRFDLTANNSNSWNVKKLAELTDGTNPQPVTTVPELALISINGTDTRFVYVGTGQYLGDTDVTTTGTQSMYGLVDDLSSPGGTTPVIGSPTRNNLQVQTLTTSGTTRTLTTNTVDYTTKKGWYVDLPSSGERISTDPALALGALIFTSNIPNTDTCSPGGSSWLNVLDYQTGGKLTGTPVAWSSTFLGDELASRVVLVKLPSGEVKGLVRGSGGNTTTTDIPIGSGSGTGTRHSWREVVE